MPDKEDTVSGAEVKSRTRSKQTVSETMPTNVKTNKKQALMYLGPNIPGGILFNGSIFKGELPAHLNATFEKLPEIKELFVEIKDVPAFKDELKRQGSEAFRMRQEIERFISKGGFKNG